MMLDSVVYPLALFVRTACSIVIVLPALCAVIASHEDIHRKNAAVVGKAFMSGCIFGFSRMQGIIIIACPLSDHPRPCRLPYQ